MGLQGKDVLDVFAAECRYRVAAMRDRVHHALAPQRQQCLAHRRDADPQLSGRLIHPDVLARA